MSEKEITVIDVVRVIMAKYWNQDKEKGSKVISNAAKCWIAITDDPTEKHRYSGGLPTVFDFAERLHTSLLGKVKPTESFKDTSPEILEYEYRVTFAEIKKSNQEVTTPSGNGWILVDTKIVICATGAHYGYWTWRRIKS